jgi:hypothetical protein
MLVLFFNDKSHLVFQIAGFVNVLFGNTFGSCLVHKCCGRNEFLFFGFGFGWMSYRYRIFFFGFHPIGFGMLRLFL